MEATFPYLLNIVAIFIALFGVYQSAIRDYEQQRDELRETRRLLEDCQRENQRLREQEFRRVREQRGGISISGGSVNIGRDAVGGDESKQDEYGSERM